MMTPLLIIQGQILNIFGSDSLFRLWSPPAAPIGGILSKISEPLNPPSISCSSDGNLAIEPVSTFTDQWWGSPKSGYSTPTPGACLVERRRGLEIFREDLSGCSYPSHDGET